jgi:hypothetical protein
VPGDLFVLPTTGELPVEWAVLERRLGQLRVVPADTHPSAGSADIEVPAGAPGGPLSLRCGLGAWVDASLFAAATRSGSLTPETVAEALQRLRRLEAGTLDSSPLAEEADVDPEYVDWIREVPERARSLILAARRTGSRPSAARVWEGYRLAALFAVVAIGLSIWVIQLRREIKVFSEPAVGVPHQEMNLGEQSRGSRTTLAVPSDARMVFLILVLDPAFSEPTVRIEIVDANDKLVWRSPLWNVPPSREIGLNVPRSFLPDGEYRIRTVPSAGGPESILQVETAR